MKPTWSGTEFQRPLSNKLKRRSLMRSPKQRTRRSRAATERCRNRRLLFREFTPGRTRSEKKHREDQGRRKQTVFAKCLQYKRLNSDQERRNHQSRAGKIEGQSG